MLSRSQPPAQAYPFFAWVESSRRFLEKAITVRDNGVFFLPKNERLISWGVGNRGWVGGVPLDSNRKRSLSGQGQRPRARIASKLLPDDLRLKNWKLPLSTHFFWVAGNSFRIFCWKLEKQLKKNSTLRSHQWKLCEGFFCFPKTPGFLVPFSTSTMGLRHL